MPRIGNVIWHWLWKTYIEFHFEIGRECMLTSDIARQIKHFLADGSI